MGESLRAAVLDNRRLANRKPMPDDRIYPSLFSLYGLHTLESFPRALWNQKPDVAIVSGGDGTLGYVVNAIRQKGGEPPVLYCRGGGSANTLLTDLVKQPKVEIPSHLQDIFREGEFEARHIHALVRETEWHGQERIAYGSYLVGFGHPTVEVTRVKESLYRKKGLHNTHRMYLIAGAISSATLLFHRTQPEGLIYQNGEESHHVKMTHAAGAAVFTTSGIGTFVFREQHAVPKDKVRLLTISADSEPELIYKYNAALLVGLRDPDRAVEKGFIDVQDVDGVQVFPARPEDPEQPNCCIDGELARENGSILLYRDTQLITAILHVPLIEQYRKKQAA